MIIPFLTTRIVSPTVAAYGWKGLAALYFVVATAPAVVILALYGMALRAETLIGHWPQVYADDPTYIGESDFLFKALGRVWEGFSILACIGLPLLLGIGFALWKRQRSYWLLLPLSIYCVGWVFSLAYLELWFWYID